MSLSKIFNDIYLHENLIHDGRVTPLTEISHVQSIADKGYVDTSKQYTSTLLADVNVQLQTINQVKLKSQLTTKSLAEVFDTLFFAVKKYPYQLPVSLLQVAVIDALSLLPVDMIEVGQQVKISSTGTINFGDSAGLIATNPVLCVIKEGITTIISEYTLTSNFNSTAFGARKLNDAIVEYKYQEATVNNDSHGIADNIGDPIIFGAGTLTEALQFNAYWSKMIGITSAAVVDLTNPATLRSVFTACDIFSDKELTENEFSIDFDQYISSATPTMNILFAIPNDLNIANRRVVVTLNDEDISSMFTSAVIANVQDASNTNNSVIDYTTYICAFTGISLNTEYRLSIKSFLIN